MSRIAKMPVVVPNDVTVKLEYQYIIIKGQKHELTHTIHNDISVQYYNNKLMIAPRQLCSKSWAIAGTTRALLNNMVIGVTKGFTKKLQLIGVGYRATVQNNLVTLFIGFSHPINYSLPLNVTAKCLNQTEILLTSANKQAVGQVAANLRAYSHPEPYKGKGIRYENEEVRIKEAKKK